jgi:hypothetical protein
MATNCVEIIELKKATEAFPALTQKNEIARCGDDFCKYSEKFVDDVL